jgi:hypothetical protein
MSAKNIEVFKRGVDAANRSDTEAFLELPHPEVEWHTVLPLVGGDAVYRGIEGVRGPRRRDAMSSLGRRQLRPVRPSSPPIPTPTPSSSPASAARRGSGLSDLQVFLEADAGTRTPDPLLTMEAPGGGPVARPIRLRSGIGLVGPVASGSAHTARYPTDTARFGPNNRSCGQP